MMHALPLDRARRSAVLFNNSEADKDMPDEGVSLRLHRTSSTRTMALAQVKVIGSSDEVHTVDALATTGEEGRGSLR